MRVLRSQVVLQRRAAWTVSFSISSLILQEAIRELHNLSHLKSSGVKIRREVERWSSAVCEMHSTPNGDWFGIMALLCGVGGFGKCINDPPDLKNSDRSVESGAGNLGLGFGRPGGVVDVDGERVGSVNGSGTVPAALLRR